MMIPVCAALLHLFSRNGQFDEYRRSLCNKYVGYAMPSHMTHVYNILSNIRDLLLQCIWQRVMHVP